MMSGQQASPGDEAGIATTRPASNSTLDLTGASIRECVGEGAARDVRHTMHPAPSIELPNQDAEYVSHIAIDIGGSLIKLVYFSPDPHLEQGSSDLSLSSPCRPSVSGSAPAPLSGSRGGRLHFVKFESSHVEDAIAFIEAKGLHRFNGRDGLQGMRVKATGGGAYKHAELFKQRLGVVLEKEDEMGCLVAGCNFLLKAITHEAFTFENSSANFVPTNEAGDLYPYLLVNIGSGVSMVQVTSEGVFERVSGSSLGGGTFWGLCNLLTGRTDFDDMLELSMQGDNSQVDMLVGDIYGGRDYSNIGLSASTIASSFGKVISQHKTLAEYHPADLCMALCRMMSYNIGQLAYLNAMRYGIKRIFFGGFFIRGHPYTMETISYAIRFWSKGDMAAMFLRHEGFLGAVGAFLLVHPGIMEEGQPHQTGTQAASKVRARFVERFSMGAPLTGGEMVGPAWGDLEGKVSWVEKFVALGGLMPARGDSPHTPAPPQEQQGQGQRQGQGQGQGTAIPPQPSVQASVSPAGGSDSGDGNLATSSAQPGPVPSLTATSSQPSQQPMLGSSNDSPFSCNSSTAQGQQPNHPPPSTELQQGPGAAPPASAPAPPAPSSTSASLPGPVPAPPALGPVQRALTGLEPRPPAGAVQRTLTAGEQPLSPAVRMALHVGVLHYSPHFDVFPLLADPSSYQPNTLTVWCDEAELHWWLAVLERALPTVVDKAAASEGGTEDAKRRAAAFGRAFGAHCSKLRAEPGAYGALGLCELFEMREECLREFGFVDVYRGDKGRENHAALCVLPDLLSELDALPPGPQRWLALIEGALAANIFDWGAAACVEVYKTGTILDIYRQARARLATRPWALDQFDSFAARVTRPSVSPPFRRVMMFVDNAGADAVLGQLPIARELLRLGCEVVMVANKLPAINDITATELRSVLEISGQHCGLIREARARGAQRQASHGGRVPPVVPADQAARLYVLANGQGSPCIDFRRVPDALAEACCGTDLIIIDGMGRAVHTNLHARFKCEALLLAMIKTEHLAKRLFGPSGGLYDCVCKHFVPTPVEGVSEGLEHSS